MRVLVFLGLWRSADFCEFSVIFLAESLPLIEDHFGGVMLLASWAIITVFPHLLFGTSMVTRAFPRLDMI
jgi:hypothetical protein